MTKSGCGFTHVYLIRAGRFLKIGHSRDPYGRAKTIQVCCPWTVSLICYFNGEETDEKRLHTRFNHHHHRGEWFKSSKEILEAFAFLVLERGGHNGRGTVSPQDMRGIEDLLREDPLILEKIVGLLSRTLDREASSSESKIQSSIVSVEAPSSSGRFRLCEESRQALERIRQVAKGKARDG